MTNALDGPIYVGLFGIISLIFYWSYGTHKTYWTYWLSLGTVVVAALVTSLPFFIPLFIICKWNCGQLSPRVFGQYKK